MELPETPRRTFVDVFDPDFYKEIAITITTSNLDVVAAIDALIAGRGRYDLSITAELRGHAERKELRIDDQISGMRHAAQAYAKIRSR